MSRCYDISDFAAFLRKYGDSAPDWAARTEEPSRDGSQRNQPDRDRQQYSSQSRNGHDRSRTIYRGRNREYSLRASEVQTLTDLGKFRMVPVDDLAQLAYRGDRSRMESDLRNLTRQGLIEEHCKMLVDDKNELWRERVRYGDACYPECARKSGPGGNFYGVQRGRSGGFLLPVAFGAKGRTQLGAPILRSDLRRLHEEQTSTEKHNVGE